MGHYCKNCGEYISNVDCCPKCKTPQTINGLKKWYAEQRIPDSETTRFFIDEDRHERKVIGITSSRLIKRNYEGEKEFVVYKNKTDGSRVIRYRGPVKPK